MKPHPSPRSSLRARKREFEADARVQDRAAPDIQRLATALLSNSDQRHRRNERFPTQRARLIERGPPRPPQVRQFSLKSRNYTNV